MRSADEIERKLPVWHALSELFVDTELQPTDYRRIADALQASGYSPDELREILADEVAPAFGSNLLSVAGEWVPWSEEEVRAIMMRSGKRVRLLKAITRRAFRRYVAAEWTKIRLLLDA